MKKIISINKFTDELLERIEKEKNIDCCKEEIRNLAMLAKKHIGELDIEVTWQE